MQQTQDLNISGLSPLVSPRELKERLPITDQASELVAAARQAVRGILEQRDRRLLVIVGPCSIHDPHAAREYAQRLAGLQARLADKLFIIMRVYFEKPRTSVGWTGLINDPHLDGSDDMQTGLELARRLLLDIAALGLSAATEMLDPIVPQYIADLVAWAAIGARTIESQTHREMASGLSMPVGFKNNTAGDLQTALNAMESARHPHSFLGIDQDGKICMVSTRGNRLGHLILRGGRKPNYDSATIQDAAARLAAAKLPPAIMVDCSHANSGKKHEKQEVVLKSVLDQRLAGNRALVGVMLESNLQAGSQPLGKDRAALRYGVSVTDECIHWETTEQLLRYAHEKLYMTV